MNILDDRSVILDRAELNRILFAYSALFLVHVGHIVILVFHKERDRIISGNRVHSGLQLDLERRSRACLDLVDIENVGSLSGLENALCLGKRDLDVLCGLNRVRVLQCEIEHEGLACLEHFLICAVIAYDQLGTSDINSLGVSDNIQNVYALVHGLLLVIRVGISKCKAQSVHALRNALAALERNVHMLCRIGSDRAYSYVGIIGQGLKSA